MSYVKIFDVSRETSKTRAKSALPSISDRVSRESAVMPEATLFSHRRIRFT